ncbi:MAG: arylsulfatase [Candidatus Thorarchaeota archaeon]
MNKYEKFEGVIGRTHNESIPWWPAPKRIGDGNPNVIIILLDDTGFAHFGCYGSSIETPNFDRLAANGIRFTNFHTTALCSPTRACLLTGRNHHTVGMRAISNFNPGFPNMRGYITPHAATLAEILRNEGYATMAVGKWHLAPMEQASVAGPFDHWPLQRGFNRFYGFMQGETDQFYPELTYDNHPVDPPYTPEEGYHVTEDFIDKSIQFIRDQKSIRPDQPFFLYLATGATHSPHQAPREFVEKYRGRFDAGWDVIRKEWYERQLQMGIIPPDTKLAPLNPGVQPWDKLSENAKKFALRLQEAFAAFLDHTDHHIGRLISFLDELGELDNTLIILLADNGASMEGGHTGVMDEFKYFNAVSEDVDAIQDRLDDIGGPHSHSNIPWGWAQVGNTPLKWYKSHIFGGGVRDPLIIHWPKRIKDKGRLRTQFHYITDITPTILDILQISPPSIYRGFNQIPISGTSMAYTFDAPEEISRKQVQHFEMFGHRGIWANGWKAVTAHRQGDPYDDKEWELYNLREDFSECNNLAEKHPDKLRKLIDLWWVEAGKHGVLPLDDRRGELFGVRFEPGSPHAHREYTYYPPIAHLPAEVSPAVGNRTWIMTADIKRSSERDDGVLVAMGTQNCGYCWYIKDNISIFDYNIFTEHHIVRSNISVPSGDCSVGVNFVRKGRNGTINLTIEGKECGSIQVPYVMRMISSTGLDIGRNSLSPITEDYKAPFEFTGIIKRINIKLPRYRKPSELRKDAEHQFHAEMSKQ